MMTFGTNTKKQIGRIFNKMLDTVVGVKRVQDEILEEIEYALAPYLHTMINNDKWLEIVYEIKSIFDVKRYSQSILTVSEICHNECSDYILEYNVSFSEGWFMYCHLRNGHLMFKFVPKEF